MTVVRNRWGALPAAEAAALILKFVATPGIGEEERDGTGGLEELTFPPPPPNPDVPVAVRLLLLLRLLVALLLNPCVRVLVLVPLSE